MDIEKMKEIKLKDGAIIYIDEFDINNERCEIYDSNKRYIDYLFDYGAGDTEIELKERYNKFIEYAQNELDSYGLFDYFCQSFDYGASPKQIEESYIDYITTGQTPLEFSNDLKAEIKEILFDLYFYTDEELCVIYDINRIGKKYFRGNW